jgi:hypothetical protein
MKDHTHRGLQAFGKDTGRIARRMREVRQLHPEWPGRSLALHEIWSQALKPFGLRQAGRGTFLIERDMRDGCARRLPARSPSILRT